jgi:putative salt-induced outer membrane protein YdiY
LKTIWRCALSILALITLSCSAAYADQVLLKNGDRITGEVVHMEGGSLLVKTDALGEVKVKWDSVAELTSVKPVHVVAGAEKLEAVAIRREQASDRVTGAKGDVSLPAGMIKTLRCQADQILYIERVERQKHPHFVDLWNGSADAGLSAARGTNDTTNMSVSLRGARTTDNTKLSLFFSSLFARTTTDGVTQTYADATRGGARYEVNMSNRIFTFGFANAESDSGQNLELRDVLGGGAGVRVTQTKTATFDIFSGASLNQERFSSTTPDRQTGELLFGEDSTCQIAKRATVGTRLSVFPNMTVPGEYRALLDATATTKLNHWLGWQITVSNHYTSNPAAGARNNELLLSTGLRVTLGQERPFKPRATVEKFKPAAGY